MMAAVTQSTKSSHDWEMYPQTSKTEELTPEKTEVKLQDSETPRQKKRRQKQGKEDITAIMKRAKIDTS